MKTVYQLYRSALISRYWIYQKLHFPDWSNYFERPFAPDNRPPVFLTRKAMCNVLSNLTVDEKGSNLVQKLIPSGEHHKWFRSMNSSQALALNILGNLAVHDLLECLQELKDDEGLPLFHPADLSSRNFAMEHKIGYLGERRRTSLDGYIDGRYRIAIECKFTENEVGHCSRPNLKQEDKNFESEHCNGTYSYQRERRERCSLTGIGVQYWKYVPVLFNWKNDIDHHPCPLHHNYQLVRNVLAAGVTSEDSVSPENGHVVLLYDERNPTFLEGGHVAASYNETKATLKYKEMLRKCPWQRITQHLRQNDILPWLTNGMTEKYGL